MKIFLNTHFSTVSINSRGFTIIKPRIVEHEPHIVHVFPWVCVLSFNQFILDCSQIHRMFDDFEVIRNTQCIWLNWLSERQRFGLMIVQFFPGGQECLDQILGFEGCKNNLLKFCLHSKSI